MAKKAKAKTDKKYLAKFQDENKDIKGDELQGHAYAGCQSDLVKLYRKNKKDIDEMAKITKQMESLKKKIDSLNVEKEKILAGWLSGYPHLKTLMLSAAVEQNLQQQAAQAAVGGAGGGRTKWTAQTLAAALQGNEVKLDAEGMVLFDNLKTVFNAQSVDILTKRFKCVTGEVQQGAKDKPWKNATLLKDHTVEKTKGERSKYRFDVKKICARLQQNN